jgi:hypothetical protein
VSTTVRQVIAMLQTSFDFFERTNTMRMTVSAILFAALTLSLSNPAVAAEPHEIWLQRLSGQWTFEWPASGDLPANKGELKWTMAPGKHCLVGHRKDGDGQLLTMLLAWEPNSKTLVQVAFGSDRSHFRIDFNEISENRIAGKASGVWKGEPNSTRVVVEAIGPDESIVKLIDHVLGGEKQPDTTSKYTRN